MNLFIFIFFPLVESDALASRSSKKLTDSNTSGKSCPRRKNREILQTARWIHFAPSGFSALVQQLKGYNFAHIINPLLNNLVRSWWLNIGLVLFLAFLFILVNKNSKITRPISSHLDLTLGQYSLKFYPNSVRSPNKSLKDWFLGKHLILFPSNLNVSLIDSREKNLAFSVGTSHKCLLLTLTSAFWIDIIIAAWT